MPSPETNPFLATASSAPPAEPAPSADVSLRTLIGAGSDKVDYRRAGVFFLAQCGAWVIGSAFFLVLAHRPLQSGFWLDWISGLLDCLVLTAALVLACRQVRHGALAALVTAAVTTAVMVPVDWEVTALHNLLAGPDTRWSIEVVPALVSQLGHIFLVILALDWALTNIRTFWIALGVGGIAGRLVAGWFSQSVWVAYFALEHPSFNDSRVILNRLLDSTISGLLTGTVFSLIFYAGFKHLGGLATLPSQTLAPGGPAGSGTDSADELRAAAAYRAAIGSLRAAGIGSIIFGLIAIGLGLSSMGNSPVNAFLAFLGLVLLVEGIWLVAAPSPVGMIVDGFALIALGIWNLFVTVNNASSGGSSSGSFALLGVWQVIWGFQSFGRYRRLRKTCLAPPTPDDMRQFDRVMEELRRSPAGSDGIIEFEAKGGPHKRWKARLLPNLGVFVCGKEAEVVIAAKTEIKITPVDGDSARSQAPRNMIELGTRKLDAALPSGVLESFQRWETAPPA